MNIDKKLVERIFSAEASDNEVKKFERWIEKDESNQIEFAILKQLWQNNNRQKQYDLDKARINIQKKVREYKSKRRIFILRRIAAVLLLPLLTLSLLFYINKQKSTEITPEYITVACQMGQQKNIKLPDSTTVKLNAGSRITFPSSFERQKYRDVAVVGEAYFDVTENESQPFIVRLGKVDVRVVGTEFNVNNYPDRDRVNVYLNSGRVDLLQYNANKETPIVTKMKPKQLATLRKNSKRVKVQPMPSEEYISWVDGYLVFDETPIKEVLQRLSKWYDVTFEYENKEIEKDRFNANLKGKELKDVLEILSFTSGIEYTIINNSTNKTNNNKLKIKLTKQ